MLFEVVRACHDEGVVLEGCQSILREESKVLVFDLIATTLTAALTSFQFGRSEPRPCWRLVIDVSRLNAPF